MKYVIPARQSSKGLPYKNRKLFKHTINTIPPGSLKDVIVTTDDKVIIKKARDQNLKVLVRDESLAQDDISIKEVMKDVVRKFSLYETETITMLYLTYPERNWEEIEDAICLFKENKAQSLLCKKDLKISPFLCMMEDGLKGKQLTPHNLYRRQDYPKCFELSHFVSIFKVGELNKLNNNMYNDKTIFYKVKNIIDVDTLEDLNKFYDKNNS